MTRFNHFFVSLLFAGLLFMSVAQADMYQQNGGSMGYAPVTPISELQRPRSYGEKIGNKALNGFANIGTAWLELPKNIINTTNQSNFFYGVFGGFLKGLVNTLGRMGCGIADVITIPLPTKPIAYPVYIWDDFDVDTSYGEVFSLDKTVITEQPIIQSPAVTQAAPAIVAPPPRPAVVDRSELYNQDTNKKLDTLFEKEMQK
ncbi:MAG: exosortase system-associated protein, TIGR04073 family [Methylococcales bacterium]|nr:exosortase system-associated protein, TIGR04073 family [Methylococcales bacterium]